MQRWMKRVAAALLLAGGAANAALLDGFEQGLAGWNPVGAVSIQTAAIGLAPTQGAQRAFISTTCGRTLPAAQVIGTAACNAGVDEHPFTAASSPHAGHAGAFLRLPFDVAGYAAVVPALNVTWSDGGEGTVPTVLVPDRQRVVAAPVSEPSRLVLTVIGLIGIAWIVRRRRQD